MLKIILLFFVVSCGLLDKTEDSKDAFPLLPKVEEMRSKYCELSNTLFEEKGFIVGKCDGLLFAALHNLSCGFPDLGPFQGEPGQWFRSIEQDCFIPPDQNNGADSQLSKDMLQGLFLQQAKIGDRQGVKDFLNFTKEHDNYFCEAKDLPTKLSKCLLPPTTWKIMIDFTKAESNLADRTLAAEGFEAHLKVLRQLQIGVVYGAISKLGLEILQGQAERQPNNPLYVASYNQFLEGDMTGAAELLLAQCPADRLPNNHEDYCSDYKYQRDETPGDWEPCPEEPRVDHFGTDCAFAATVILGEIQ
jgi:hypothetical protein